ncbi:MAG: DUF3857 domain-containing protein [Bacteroidales bacterium]|nr:DUF3857 domain-containing protein [Bacteroidales bacterium]
MKKIFFIAAIISIFNIQLSTLKAQEPDARFKTLKYEWTMNADGTSDYHYRHEVQILRNRALVAYADKGETFVVFNPDLEELTVNEVYTIQKDGTRVDMPQNAFVYQLPSQCTDCGRFNHLRELAMVHTGMELGCTIVVDYTIHRHYNYLHESIPLWRECPVDRLEVVVNYNHNDMEMKYTIDGVQNLPENSVKKDELDNGLHYTFENLQQAPKEPYMPADYVPVLRIHNGIPEFTPAFDNAKFSGAQDAMSRIAGRGSKRDKVNAIRDFVVDNIHLNNIDPAHLGYTHATAEEVWQTGCGTATDKAVLLAALLNDEGFEARVLGDEMDEVGVVFDTLEYRLSARSKAPMYLYGEAKDEMVQSSIKESREAKMDTLQDGFYRLKLDPVAGAPAISAKRLALYRTTPLQSTACDLKSDISYTLPEGLKMVAPAQSRKLDFDGVGSVEITIKQSGKKVRVVRNMKLEKGEIALADYSAYRQLIALWQSVDGVLLQQK